MPLVILTPIILVVIIAAGILLAGRSGSATPVPTAIINFQATADTRATQEWQQVLGQYHTDGVYPNGTSYSGTLKINPNEDGTAYKFDWKVQETSSTGVGVKVDDFLAASYGESCGVILSKIQPDQSLSGIFAYGDVSGTETDQRTNPSSSPGNLTGIYRSTVNINGQSLPQDLKLTVAEQNGGHVFTWSTSTTGFSLQNGNMVAVVYGPEGALSKCGVLLYRIQPDGSLRGQFSYGYGSDGTENDSR
jgi:hypothetical protein